jgi:hypothetical protein
MQNRTNRCAFAMTDFSAVKSLGHLADFVVSCTIGEPSFHKNVPRGTLEMAGECSTWNITRSMCSDKSVPRGTLHDLDLCSTWNTRDDWAKDGLHDWTIIMFVPL